MLFEILLAAVVIHLCYSLYRIVKVRQAVAAEELSDPDLEALDKEADAKIEKLSQDPSGVEVTGKETWPMLFTDKDGKTA